MPAVDQDLLALPVFGANSGANCLILTCDQEPIPYVKEKAKEMNIPLVLVENDTLDTLAALEKILENPENSLVFE